MARIFITGSTDGLGLAGARALMDAGHEVLLHARTKERATALNGLTPHPAGVVIGDLSSSSETRDLAGQVNEHGRMDAIIHNAGVYLSPQRIATFEGHSRTLAVNVLAPYILTALIERPDRLIYVSSGLHLGATADLQDIDWTRRDWDAVSAYSESKLHVSALSAAVSRHWPTVLSNSVDPGWVPTKMGGPGAPGDLAMGHDTQSWLAVSNDPAALVSGNYWHHRRQRTPAPEVTDPGFQDSLTDKLAELTGIPLF
ncbi:SDR family NAD(P)-dependent oxidoreductase [Pseudarthrobacter sp. 1C304]|uniref:SDR family NAD(P)-dependent oxidoreductase n=1 Tax=Pseudarthrobacter sp. 1C304 TaxID=3457438 RepID=UPI003FD5AC20